MLSICNRSPLSTRPLLRLLYQSAVPTALQQRIRCAYRIGLGSWESCLGQQHESSLTPLSSSHKFHWRGLCVRGNKQAMSNLRPRVAIIGAGAAGLCTARELLSHGHPVTIYEATSHIGGTWAYSPVPSPSTSLYESLRCNLPHQAMCFTDKPFPPGTRSFCGHKDVLSYLSDFTEEHDLRRHVVFNARVTAVSKVSDVWIVRVGSEEHAFGAVAIAVGHYTTPNPWRPAGTEEFCQEGRTVTHSHNYKTPHRYKGRRVVVAGAGPSGVDIAIELSNSGAEVILSHAKWRSSVLQGTTREVGRLADLTASGEAVSVDGERFAVDDVVLCTGYQYRYPFLKEGEAGVRAAEDGRSVRGLVGHLFARKDPTLAFLGLLWKVAPFPIFQDQAAFLAALWGNRLSRQRLAEYVRIESEDWDLAMEGEPRFLHRLGSRQWEYRRRLADWAGRPMPVLSVQEIYQDASVLRRRYLRTYREREYVLLGSGSGEWRAIQDGADVTGTGDPASPHSYAQTTQRTPFE